jgi:beta-glucanase (GH16 family)
MPRAALLLPLIALIAFAAPQTASAAAPRVVVPAPVAGSIVAGKFPIRAQLTVKRHTRVRVARFYVQGSWIATDRRAPFTLNAGALFDTAALPSGANQLHFKVKYTVRRPGGRFVKKIATRVVSVDVFHPPTAAQPLPANWKIGFDDDFSNPATSAANWKTIRDDWIKDGRPYSNLEGAGYSPSNVSVANGSMNLRTSDRGAAGLAQSTGSVNTNTKFAFQYGYLESRIFVPSCSGCWPAFWLLPSSNVWPPEIDIFEFFNTEKDTSAHSSLHWPANTATKEDFRTSLLRINDGDNYVGSWHTYAMLWTANQIQFYIDGLPGPQFSDPSQIPHQPMYPILQLAVQSGHIPAVGSTMQVDYVRAWLPTG